MCIQLAQLADLALAVSVGTADLPAFSAAMEHLAVCARCRKLCEEYLATVELARRALDLVPESVLVADCLDDETLAACADQGLNDARRELALRHLASCVRCVREFLRLLDILAEVGPVRRTALAAVVLEVGRRGLRLLMPPGVPDLQPGVLEPVPVLGGLPQDTQQPGPACTWVQTAGDLRLEFAALRVDDAHVDLSLNVTRTVGDSNSAYVTLYLDGRMVQSDPVNAGGGLLLRNLDLMDYEGEVQLASGEIARFAVSLLRNARQPCADRKTEPCD